MKKQCNKCHKEKELTEFHKDKTRKDGHQSICRTCSSKDAKAWRESNKHIISEKAKIYRLKNKDLLRKRKSEFYYKNKESILATQKKWWDKSGRELNNKRHKYKMKADREYRDRSQNYINLWKKRQKETLSDYYILELIIKGNDLERKDIPRAFIEAKRQHLQIRRDLLGEVSPGNKRCTKCKKIKILSEFYKNKSKKDNLSTECKKCADNYCKRYQQIKKGVSRDE